MEMHTQDQRCRMYFGKNWLSRIHESLRPERIVPQIRVGEPSKRNLLAAHVHFQLTKMGKK